MLTMKKYLGLFLIFSTLFFTSCDEELLEPFTPGAIPEEEAVQTTADLSRLMNAAYGILTPFSEIEFNSIFTDEAGIGYANGGQGLDDNYAFLLNPASDSANGIWDTHYITLSRVNRVIKFSANVTPVDAADQAVFNRLLAEAYTLRAHCHLQLLAHYSTNPKDLNALGVVLSNDVFLPSYVGSRVANSQVYNLIDNDLTQAEALYATVPSADAVNPIYANKIFTSAVRARAYALRGDYPNALTYANQIIAIPGLSLSTGSTYRDMFLTDATGETIFKIDKATGQTRIGNIWASVNSTVSGSPFYEMGRSLFNILNTTNLPSATSYTVTAIAGTAITIPGHTLVVNDMFVSTQNVPSNATYNGAGTATVPANSLVAGKVYFVRSVSGNNITLTDSYNGTSNINFSAANGTSLSIPVKTNDGDVRYSTMVHPTSIIDFNYQTSSDFRNTDKIAIRKYPGAGTNGNLVNDIKICRLSEIYLIKAEAEIAAGNLTAAATTIQTLRNARFNKVQPLPVYANATDAWKAVLQERRIELAFEGFRYVDLKRIGSLAGETISRDSQDCAFNGACSLPLTDFRFTMPIPQDETNANGGIQQNPGY